MKADAIEQRVQEALDYLAGLDREQLAPGKHEVNDWFFYSVFEYESKLDQEGKLESHRDYIDIQWIVAGEEAFNVADIASLERHEAYDPQKDIMFWNPRESMMKLVLRKDSYVVLYPQDGHRGGMAVKAPAKVRKLVGKVRCS